MYLYILIYIFIQQHAEFTLTKQIRKQTIEETRKLLKKWEKFWISKVKTLYPDGLNQELNDSDWSELLVMQQHLFKRLESSTNLENFHAWHSTGYIALSNVLENNLTHNCT